MAAKAEVAEHGTDETALVHWTAVEVPMVHVRIPVLGVRVPHPAALASTRWGAQALRAYLPPTQRLAYYGGLGLMAAVGVLDWPVAAAAGVGVWVASHTGQHRVEQTLSDAERIRSEPGRVTEGHVVRPGGGARRSRAARPEAAG
jgi:hypothetical protein